MSGLNIRDRSPQLEVWKSPNRLFEKEEVTLSYFF